MDLSLSKLWGTVKDRGAWHAAVYEVAKSRTQVNNSDNIGFTCVPLATRALIDASV